MSLRNKILMAMMSVLIAAFVAALLIISNITFKSMKHEATKLGTAFAYTLRDYTVNMVLLEDYYQTYNLIQQIMDKNPFLGYIYIIDDSKDLFVSSFSSSDAVENINFWNPVDKESSVTLIKFDGKIYRDIGIKMIEGLNYELHIGIKEDNVISTFSQTTKTFIVAFLVIAFFILFISFFISNFVTKTIRNVADFSQELMQRKFGLQLKLKGSKETKQLIKNMNMLSRELEKYEEQLKHDFRELLVVEKLSVLHTFKAGLLHDIKSSVTSLKLLMSNGFENFDDEDFQVCKGELKKVEHIMKSIFTDMPYQLEVNVADVHSIVRETLSEFESTLKSKQIEVHWEDNDNIDILKCYPDLVKLMVFNIISNSIDAVSHSGNIFISLKAESEGIELLIKDDGAGIDNVIKDKLYDPFFTTKKSGTGLGLYLVYNVVKLHNGNLRIFEDEKGLTVVEALIKGVN